MKRDEVCKAFFEDNERFADILNIYTDESAKISATDIQEVNSELIINIPTETKGKKKLHAKPLNRGSLISKYRDIVRKVAFRTTFIIADIEPQDNIDYSYPLRELGYIYGEYEKQARVIRKYIKRNKGNLTKDELLYLFAKDSRLNPTVIILLYSGEEEWNGPTELWQMLDMEGIPEGLKSLIMNHRIHMIDIRRLPNETLENFESDVGKVFKSIIYSDNEDLFCRLIEEDPYFTNMDEDAYDLVSAYASIHISENKENLRTEEGGISMCKAFDDHYESGRQQGIEQGIEQGIAQGIAQGKELLLLALISDGEITIENAAKRMNMTPNEFAKKYNLPLGDH